jgi:hypothetical protein
MGKRNWLVAAVVLAVAGGVFAYQRPFREFTGNYDRFTIPPDSNEKTEWVFGRLMYPSGNSGFGGGGGFGRRGGFRGGRDWRQGGSSWTIDYPRSDRHFVQAVRRLTRIHARSVEQPVNVEEGDQFDWPWLYAVEVGQWDLTDEVAKGLREHLLRGGFLMVDDFHGTAEWSNFVRSMSRVFPDRAIVDLPPDDAIFHIIYDLDTKYQVPGQQYVRSHQTYEKDGFTPQWRGIFDDNHRLMVAICHNMDLGDSWEWADDQEYPEKFSALGIRIGVNYVVYGMTH